MAVEIDDRAHPGPPRRRLTEEDRPLAEEVQAAARTVQECETNLEYARAWRWGAVSRAYQAGFHPLDIARLAQVRRRTARDWQARWTQEQAPDQAQRPVETPDLAS